MKPGFLISSRGAGVSDQNALVRRVEPSCEPLCCMSTISRLMSRKRPKVNTDVLDTGSAQLRTRPFGRGLLDISLVFDSL